METERINLMMTTMDALMAMTEGNPGALVASLALIEKAPAIDPDDFMGGLGKLLACDTLGLYGPRLYMLHNDVCGSDLTKMIAVLRAWQLGFVTKEQVGHAVDNYGEGINVDALLAQVRERLPKFGSVTA